MASKTTKSVLAGKMVIDKIIKEIESNVGWLVNSQPTLLNEGALSTIRSILELNLNETGMTKSTKPARGKIQKVATGLFVGRGRWKEKLYEGDVVEDKSGNRFKIVYQKEWGAFVADQKDGDLLFLAQNERWTDGTKLLISEVKKL